MNRNENVASSKRSSRCRFAECTYHSWSNVPHIYGSFRVNEGDNRLWISAIVVIESNEPLTTTLLVFLSQSTVEGHTKNRVLSLLVVLHWQKPTNVTATFPVPPWIVLPWTKKKNHSRDLRWEERCSFTDIVLDDARSAQVKSRGQSRIGPCPTLIAHDQAWSKDRTVFFSPQISGMVLFLSRVVPPGNYSTTDLLWKTKI